MAKGLTKKQRGFVKDYVATENGTQAALKHYDIESPNPEKVASVIATENLSKPSIIEAVKEEQKRIADSIPDALLTERHLELLNKRETIIINSEVIERGPDTQAVKAGLEMAYKLKGSYAPEKSLNINIEAEPDVVVKELTEKLNAIHRSSSEPGNGRTASSLGTETQNQE